MPTQQIPFEVLASGHAVLTTELRQSYKDARYYSPVELAGYSERLVEIGKIIAQSPIDLMLVPYRGGIAPSLQLQVMNKMQYDRVPIGFTQGSSQKHWSVICEELVSKLEDYSDRQTLTIGIVDTAVSGHSSAALGEIMLMAKEHFNKQSWLVNFYLLHSPERHYVPELSFGVRKLSRPDLIFNVDLFEVPSLLVDDWDAGTGVRADWNGEHCIYRATGFGQMMVRQPDGSVLVIQSPKINQYYDVLVSNVISEVMLTDPSIKLLPPNDPYWNRL